MFELNLLSKLICHAAGKARPRSHSHATRDSSQNTRLKKHGHIPPVL